METIAISVPMGRGIKYFLDTPLYDHLRRQYHVILLSPFSLSNQFRIKYGGGGVEFYPHPGMESSFITSLLVKIYMRFRWFHSDFRLSSLSIGKGNLYTKKLYFSKTYFLNKVMFELCRFVGGWETVNSFTHGLFKVKYYEELFSEITPNIAISVNPSKLVPDYCFQYSAKSHRVPLVFFPSSWDNFTRSGEFPFMPDRVFSWGEEMSRHAREFFSFDDATLFNAGMIRMESVTEPMGRDELCRRMNIPSDHKIILFPTNQDYLVANEPAVLADLVGAVAAGRLGKATVIVRPNNTTGKFQKEYLSIYKDHPHVRLNIPENDSGGDYGELDVTWRDVLSNVDVVITICSMMVIEAFFYDKPVINIDFDDGIMNEYGYSFRFYYNREVYRRIRELGATTFAQSREELFAAICAYCENPSLHREARLQALRLWDEPPSGGKTRCERAFEEINAMISSAREAARV